MQEKTNRFSTRSGPERDFNVQNSHKFPADNGLEIFGGA